MSALKQCFDAIPDFILEKSQEPLWSWQWRGLSGSLQEVSIGLNMSLVMQVKPTFVQLQDASFILMSTENLANFWWHLEQDDIVLNALIPKFILENGALIQDNMLKFSACSRFFSGLWLGNLPKGATLKQNVQDILNDIV